MWFICVALRTPKPLTHTSHKPPSDKYVNLLQLTVDTHYGPETIFAVVQRLRLTKDKSDNEQKGEDSVRVTNRNFIFNQGGRHLKLNDLNVDSSRFTKELSPWVQWYKQYLDCYFHIAEVLGATPNIKESSEERLETQRVSSYTTDCILKQTGFLVDLFENIKARPETPTLKSNKTVIEMIGLMVKDCFSVMRLIKIRFEELNARKAKPDVMFPVLVRLEKCKEALSDFSWQSKYLVEDFWCLVLKLKQGDV